MKCTSVTAQRGRTSVGAGPGRPRKRSTTAAESGLTLLEVLAALSVFLIGIMGVLSLFSSGTRMHQQSQRMGEVANLVEEVILRIEREIADTAISEDGILPGAEDVRLPGHERFRYSYTLEPVYVGAGHEFFRLDGKLQWKEGGKIQTYPFQQILRDLRPLAVWVDRSRSPP